MLKKIPLSLAGLMIMIVGFSWADDQKEEARQHYLKGNTYYLQEKYQEAEAEFNLALELLNQKKAEQAKPLPSIPLETNSPGEYLINDEDEFFISVWQNPDLNQEVMVRPDGKISFSLVGDVQAKGRTIPGLRQDLTERLEEYLRYPDVSITIRKLGGRKIFVLGDIASPGIYTLTGTKTIMEAIAAAGGFTREAVPSSTLVVRSGLSDKPQPMKLNLSKLMTKGDISQNIVLESGDIVFVPKKFISDVSYVLNQVLDLAAKGDYTYGGLVLKYRDIHRKISSSTTTTTTNP